MRSNREEEYGRGREEDTERRHASSSSAPRMEAHGAGSAPHSSRMAEGRREDRDAGHRSDERGWRGHSRDRERDRDRVPRDSHRSRERDRDYGRDRERGREREGPREHGRHQEGRQREECPPPSRPRSEEQPAATAATTSQEKPKQRGRWEQEEPPRHKSRWEQVEELEEPRHKSRWENEEEPKHKSRWEEQDEEPKHKSRRAGEEPGTSAPSVSYRGRWAEEDEAEEEAGEAKAGGGSDRPTAAGAPAPAMTQGTPQADAAGTSSVEIVRAMMTRPAAGVPLPAAAAAIPAAATASAAALPSGMKTVAQMAAEAAAATAARLSAAAGGSGLSRDEKAKLLWGDPRKEVAAPSAAAADRYAAQLYGSNRWDAAEECFTKYVLCVARAFCTSRAWRVDAYGLRGGYPLTL
jgi:hypothetical protein